ncbi:MAG: hypothetical protein WCP57_03150 [Bacteroidota bacterium]
MKKIYYLNAFLILSILFLYQLSHSQEKKYIPIEVNLDQLKRDEFPAIYLGCVTYLYFANNFHVDSIKFPFQNEFDISNPSKNNFVIDTRAACYEPNDSTIQILVFTQTSTFTFNISYIPFPPVKIIALDSMHKEIDLSNGTIKYCGEILFKGILDYPKYCQPFDRYRGYYRVAILDVHSNELIKTEGWYDRGDYSRPIDLSVFNQLKSIYIHFDNKGLFKYYYPMRYKLNEEACPVNQISNLKLSTYNKRDICIRLIE